MQALGQLIKKILPDRKRGVHTSIGVYLTPEQAWVVAMRRVGSSGYLVEAQASEKLGKDNWAETLFSLCQSVSPRGGAVAVALAPAFYSLLLVDAPAVSENELRDAVKWRIKDLVNIPLDALVVDAFALPKDAYRGRLNMIYAAATDKQTVQKLAGLSRDSFELVTVTIQELAVVQACSQDAHMQQGSTALLQFMDNSGAIYLFEGSHLYLSRTLDLSARDSYSGTPAQDLEQKIERLALDVQRSLDYYESQIGKSAPVRVVWVRSTSMNAALAESLQSRLNISIIPFDLTTLAEWKTVPEEHDHLAWIIACGAALRGVACHAAH